MSKSKIEFILIIVLLFATSSNIFAQTVPPAGSEAKLLAVLKTEAPHKAKVDALRQLSFIATRDAVPALSKLLADPKLSHMARYAMEPIPDISVDIAFRRALDELKGPQLVGLIGSIGVRDRYQNFIAPLTNLLHDHDPLVAQAAARALGSISRSEAAASAQIMLGVLKTTPAQNKPSFYEGIFRCAESLTTAKPNEAVKIYNAMIALNAPHQIRAGALRGAILASGRNGYKIIEKHLKNKNYIMFSAAVQIALENPYPMVVKVLSENISKLTGDNKILVIQALGNCADPAATPALTAAAKSGSKDARIAAVRSLAQIGDSTSVTNLASLLADKDTDVADAALVGLAYSPNKAADKITMDMLSSNNTNTQLKAIDIIGRRRISNVTSSLFKAAKDNDESVRAASIVLLGNYAKTEDIPLLVNLLLNASGKKEIREAERAITNVTARQAKLGSGNVEIIKAIYGAVGGKPSRDVTEKLSKIVASGNTSVKVSNANFGDAAPGIVKKLQVDFSVNGVPQSITIPENGTAEFTVAIVPDELIEQVSSAMVKASTQQKLALLRILRATNSPKALETITTATQDKNSEIEAEAISLLCSWPTADALPHIMPLTKSANSRSQILALRGALRLIPLQDVSIDIKQSSFKQISSLTKRNEEKKLLISALAKVPSARSLDMVIQYLNDNATKQEAAIAAITIAEKIIKSNPAEVAEAMKQIQKKNDKFADRAKQLLAKVPAEMKLDGFRTIFNGKNLTGWEISGKCKWWVEDGQLIGTQGDKFAPGDLFTKQSYDDFELNVVYRVEWPCNTGVWFRYQSPSQAYQADILEYKNPVAFSGTLYCPGKMFLAANEDKSLIDRQGWNTIHIRAKGDHVQTWINSNKIADVHDTTTNTGKIGFQIHPGDQFGKMKVVIKKIMIKEL